MSRPDDEEIDALRPISIEDGVVTRPAGAWSSTVHDFLRHLRSQGLDCVPEPLGIERDVERLIFIDGESGGDGWWHQHADAGLRSAARLLRRVHDASTGWRPPADAAFRVAHVEAEADAEAVWCGTEIPSTRPAPHPSCCRAEVPT